MLRAEEYVKELKKRSRRSNIYRKYQLIGLELADILSDPGNKSLYMRLAKERNPDALMALAKRVAEKRNISNKGAYFMAMMKGIPRSGAPKAPKKKSDGS